MDENSTLHGVKKEHDVPRHSDQKSRINQVARCALDADTVELLGGRLAIIAAILMFIGLYGFGIHEFGIALGFLLGWLPCSLVAWATAHILAPVLTDLVRIWIFIWRGVDECFTLIKRSAKQPR